MIKILWSKTYIHNIFIICYYKEKINRHQYYSDIATAYNVSLLYY